MAPSFLLQKRESSWFLFDVEFFGGEGCSHCGSCFPHLTNSSFFFQGRKIPTHLVFAYRSCSTHAVSTSPPLKLFQFYCPYPCPLCLFFPSELHPVFQVWVEHGIPEWYNFLILCSCPNNPEHVICLFWPLPSANLVFHGSIIDWRTRFFEW